MWCRMIWCLFGHLLFNVCIRHKMCRVVSVFGQSKRYIALALPTMFTLMATVYVSVCSNIWNVDLSLSEGGSKLLEMLVYGLNSVEYRVEGLLSGWTIPDIRELLEGRHLVQLPHQILQHIKSLGVTFYSLYHKDLDILADSIPHLHCLTSLDISQ